MRLLFSLLLVFFLVVPLETFADPTIYHGRRQYKPYLTKEYTSFDLGVGVRRNNFDWNIASDLTGTATPNILSELTWEDIVVLEATGTFRHEEPIHYGFFGGALMMEGELKAGITVSGDNQDSDYNGDNRTLEFSRSNNDSSDGYSIGGAVAVGHKFYLTRPHSKKRRSRLYRRKKRSSASRSLFSFTPLIGYGWDQQQYKITDGFQTIPATGPFGGLDSEYIATWHGPFVGLEAELENKKHLFRLRGEYHDLNYDAEAVWNLRSDFQQDPSFEHEADGDGIKIDAQYGYAIDSRYEATIDASYQKRTAEDGRDTVFFSNGTVTSLKLNEVNDESHSLRFGLRYNWD